MSVLPKRKRGRQTAAGAERFEAEKAAFCQLIRQIESSVDFKLSSRGLCYMLEEHGLTKGEFNAAQKLINDCRKDGSLPIHITADDASRAPECMESGIDGLTPEEYADYLAQEVATDYLRYYPTSFWDDQEYYVEMLVEKIDLKSLFRPICDKYHIPIANAKGWTDINSRAHMMRRFMEHEEAGRNCVLLYCGDHDPGGLNISKSLRQNLDQLSDAVGWTADFLIIDRFGLNYDFIKANNLTWIDNIETSSGGRLDNPSHADHDKPYVQDYLAKYGARKVEANALVVAAAAGRKLCLDSINKYIDADAPTKHRERIEERQLEVKEFIPAALERVLSDMEG
jgi:hypothetical protein